MTGFGPFERTPRLAVAVSGGPDSLALMLLADTWARARGGRVLAQTVDHGLRPEAAAEAHHGLLPAAEREDIEVGCEFCGQQYRFDAVDAAQIFVSPAVSQPPGPANIQ